MSNYLQFLLIFIFACICSFSKIGASKTKKFTYISPRNGSKYNSVKSPVIIKVSPNDQKKLSSASISANIIGSQYGEYNYKLKISENTIILTPETKFQHLEKIKVEITSLLPDYQNTSFSFATYEYPNFTAKDFEPIYRGYESKGTSLQTQKYIPDPPRQINGISVPSDFPQITISKHTAEASQHKLFLANLNRRSYLMVLNNEGTPLYYYRQIEQIRDFKVQPTGVLTFSENFKEQCYFGLNSNFELVDTFRATSGYYTDHHELRIQENGTYFLFANGIRKFDMSQVITGGHSDADLYEFHIQGFDKNHNLVFEWLCSDYFDVLDAIHENLTFQRIDYVHMNSLDFDFDGNLLISSRNLDEITKIDIETGNIIWRLGGENNQFQFINDDRKFTYQHHIRAIPEHPGHYLIFDNGNYSSPAYSRAVEYKLNTDNMTAEQVWEYSGNKDILARYMGSAERLENGNTLINYALGGLPKALEVNKNGEIVFEADFINDDENYRSFRFDYTKVSEKPYLVAESLPDKVALTFNKFGDTGIKEYIIYKGDSEHSLQEFSRTEQNYADLTGLENFKEIYFAAKTVKDDDSISPLSNIEKVKTKFIPFNGNHVLNGDFTNQNKNWYVVNMNSSQFTWNNDSDKFNIIISNPGTRLTDIQLRQDWLCIEKGHFYKFEFDASSSKKRSIEFGISMSGGAQTNYSKFNPIIIDRQIAHYEFVFEMEHTTSRNSKVFFNFGESSGDVTLDNISVTEVASLSIKDDRLQVDRFSLSQNYPNPFNPGTTISFTLPEAGMVTLSVFNILGEEVISGNETYYSAGTHNNFIDGSGLSSGVYFYQVTYSDGSNKLTKTNKMLLMK